MSPAEVFEVPDTSKQLRRYTPTDAAIAKMAESYMPLTIKGVEDTNGYKLVHAARMDVKARRVEVEKLRKELKADALEYGRQVDSEAKRITALLTPIEDHLAKQEEAYEAAKEAIRNAERLKAEAEAKAKAEAEAARLKAEQEAAVEKLRIEREKLEAERRAMEAELAKIEAEQAAERARQKAEQDKIDAERRAVEAEQKRLADIEAARLRKIEEERIAKEAAEKARIETEARIAREAAAKKAAEEAETKAEEEARLRAEALRPDREKLLAVADTVANIVVPEVSDAGRDMAMKVRQIIVKAAQDIAATANYEVGK